MEKNQFREIWVFTEDEQAMCALMNGAQGWLMYVREEGDAGFHSINPGYDGDRNAVMEFYLNNGQRDEYPVSYVIPAAEIERALQYFENEKKPPDFITWHNDSNDGAVIK